MRRAKPHDLLRKACQSSRHLGKHFRTSASGATAVEFGLVSIPFFGLLLALFQTGLYFFTSETLQVAVESAARKVYTGTVQSNGVTDANTFATNYLCPATGSRLPSFIDCSKLIIDVRTASSFSSADLTKDFYKNPSQTFCPGAPDAIVIVRVIYPMPALIPLIGSGGRNDFGVVSDVPNNSGPKQLVMGTAVFQNEPHPGSAYVPAAGC